MSRSRQDRFDDLVLDAVERIEGRVGAALVGVEFAVEDVPADPPETTGPVPLGRADAARPGRPGRVVVYRRPVELRAEEAADRAALVHEVVVEQVAALLGVPPRDVDPDYDAE